MDRSTKGLRAAAGCGLLTLLISIGLTFFYPLALDTLPAGFFTPILALEFATSLNDARDIFAGDQALVAQMQRGHWLDMLFLLAYGTFLVLPNAVLWQRQRHWSSLAGMVAAAVAALADILENTKLLQLGDALLQGEPAPDFVLLRLYVGIKFLAISITMLCLGRSLFRYDTLGKLFAALSLVLVPVTMLALDGNPVMIEAMGLITAAGWLILLVWLLRMRNGLPVVAVAKSS